MVGTVYPVTSPIVTHLDADSLPGLLDINPQSFHPLFVLQGMLDSIFYRNLYHHGRKYFLVKMDGSIYVRDTLTLKDTSRVKADLHIQHLVVEYGAHFDGQCSTLAEGEFEKVSGTEPKSE